MYQVPLFDQRKKCVFSAGPQLYKLFFWIKKNSKKQRHLCNPKFFSLNFLKASVILVADSVTVLFMSFQSCQTSSKGYIDSLQMAFVFALPTVVRHMDAGRSTQKTMIQLAPLRIGKIPSECTSNIMRGLP
jgi:hypothetical protein